MPRFFAAPLFAIVLLAGCDQRLPVVDHQSEWRDVLERKKAAAQPTATSKERQHYADSLAAFRSRHPKHTRSREVYDSVRLEFARELARLGHHEQALRFYRAVLASDPANREASDGVQASLSRMAVTPDRLSKLEKGMTQEEVTQILGNPRPGWAKQSTARKPSTEAWYYRTANGGVAAVYFRGGRVVAAEPSADEPVAR